jgi:FKBP-type peptidyl-prolyl cis-trans isomerase (trigger factor)
MSESVIKSYPEAEYVEYYQYFKSVFTDQAEYEGLTLQEFLDRYGDYYYEAGIYSGMTVAQFENVAQDYARSQVVNDLVLYSIMRKENIKLEGKEWEAAIRQLELETGSTYEQLVERYEDETVIIISVLSIRAKDIITAGVTVVDN